MIKKLWTLRSLRHQVFRQILEGWENDFSQELNLVLTDKGNWEKRANGRIGALLRKIDPSGRFFSDQGCIAAPRETDALMFAIFAPQYANAYIVQSNVIPIIIDCWRESLDSAAIALKKVKAVFVTNIELVAEFENRRPDLPVIYVPLAVESAQAGRRFSKRCDLIQVGRRNEKLHTWALQLVKECPILDYWYAEINGAWPRWISTQQGELTVGLDRESFLATLGGARVALVSAPGIDGGETRTGGFNPVTPRFYEAAALGCRMVGRYPRNGLDYLENDIASVCPHVESYDEFSQAVNSAIGAGPDDTDRTREFVHKHTAQAMAKRVRMGLERLGHSFPSTS